MATTAASVAEYRSMFQNWNARASVRVKPQRVLVQDLGGSLYFPPELVPAISHPLVRELGEPAISNVMVHRLYQYLHFTTVLEAVAVIPVAIRLSLGDVGAVPTGMRGDAFKIVTDEAWHSQFSNDLVRQVECETGVTPWLPARPQFVERLAALRESVDRNLAPLCDLFFSVVSETLISAILSDIPRDVRLRPAVRDLIADHAEDEGRHHAYFRSLLAYVWPTLDKRERKTIGPLIPDLIRVFLEPDYSAVGHALIAVGVRPAAVPQIILECYSSADLPSTIQTAARPTVRYFAEAGAMDDPATLEAFQVAGFRVE